MDLLSLSYWFNSRPEPFTAVGQFILILGIAFFIALAIVSWNYCKKKIPIYNKLWHSLLSFGIANTIIGIVWTFFDYQMIPILMSKIWYLLWLLGVIFWIILIIRQFRKIPARKQELAKQREFEQYLPK